MAEVNNYKIDNDNSSNSNNKPDNYNNLGYSFWVEQIDLQSSSDDVSSYNRISEHPKDDIYTPVKTRLLRKFTAITAAALLFGLIAAVSFLVFNKIYYHYNPYAEPVSIYSKSSRDSLTLDLAPPEGKVTLSTTNVFNNVSYYQETDISEIINKTKPATVSITSIIQSTAYIFGNPYTEESSGQGSGIIIGENDTEYLIATNSHVVSDAASIEVYLIDDSVVNAYLKGKDAEADLAVIAIKKSDLSKETINSITIAELGNSDDVKVGQMVIAIGNALGYGQSVTVGYVSAKDRVITNSITNTTLTVFQVDAAINPGNSGGALLNAAGEVIGINSAKLTGVKVEGIGYAIPITKAFPIVKDLMDRETLAEEDKGYLGISMSDMSDITLEISASYNWPEGVYIRKMTEGSAADKAGIRTGDIITDVNGTKISNKDQLREKITSYRYDTVVSIKVMRYNGRKFEELAIDVKLAKISN